VSPTDARTRLRDAALDLFGRRGVNATSTRAILAEAGLRNPSAINYHFGSKAQLVEDLVGELIHGQAPVMQRQVTLAREARPTVEAWTSVAVDSASDLISTERGCLLARLWWEYDGSVQPTAFEMFLLSGHPLAESWTEAVVRTFPELPRQVAVTRNVIMLRTLEWMIARRAARILGALDVPTLQMDDAERFRVLMLEIAVAMLAAPTRLREGDITLG
jgi:AcrR family transcriptional regulator